MRTRSLCFEVTLYLVFTIIDDKNVSGDDSFTIFTVQRHQDDKSRLVNF